MLPYIRQRGIVGYKGRWLNGARIDVDLNVQRKNVPRAAKQYPMPAPAYQ